MQGEVRVPYSGIGGTNLHSDIMTMGLAGSSQDSELTGGRDQTWNILWSLPGGITNIRNRPGYQGGEWGYLFGAAATTGVVTDETLIVHLQEKYGTDVIDNSGNILQPSYESVIQAYINNLVYEYTSRAMQGLDDLSWDRFRDYYGLGTCVIFLG